jgi:DNA-binding CsgD family transcriptional regulator
MAGPVADGRIARARVRAASGRWLVVRGSVLADAPGAQVAVMIEPARPHELAPLVADAYGLTEREREVTRLVARGLQTNAIAARMHLSPWTVQDHVKAIFEKVGGWVTQWGGDVGEHLDPAIPAADLAELMTGAGKMAGYVDEHIAHADARARAGLPTLRPRRRDRPDRASVRQEREPARRSQLRHARARDPTRLAGCLPPRLAHVLMRSLDRPQAGGLARPVEAVEATQRLVAPLGLLELVRVGAGSELDAAVAEPLPHAREDRAMPHRQTSFKRSMVVSAPLLQLQSNRSCRRA